MKKFKKWLHELRYGKDPFEGYTFTQPFIGLINQPPGEYVKPLPKDRND